MRTNVNSKSSMYKMINPENHTWYKKGIALGLPNWAMFNLFNFYKTISKIYTYYFLNIIFTLICYAPLCIGLLCLGELGEFPAAFTHTPRNAGVIILGCFIAQIILAPFNAFRLKYLHSSILEIPMGKDEGEGPMRFSGTAMINIMRTNFLSSIFLEIIICLPVFAIFVYKGGLDLLNGVNNDFFRNTYFVPFLGLLLYDYLLARSARMYCYFFLYNPVKSFFLAFKDKTIGANNKRAQFFGLSRFVDSKIAGGSFIAVFMGLVRHALVMTAVYLIFDNVPGALNRHFIVIFGIYFVIFIALPRDTVTIDVVSGTCISPFVWVDIFHGRPVYDYLKPIDENADWPAYSYFTERFHGAGGRWAGEVTIEELGEYYYYNYPGNPD